MYMPYLMYAYAAALTLMLMGCRVAMQTIPALRGLRLLAAALACGLLAVLLLAARPWAPAWASILVANGAIFASSLLYYCCVAKILSQRTRFLLPCVALAIAGVAGDAWFTWPHPGLMQRILISSGLNSVFAALAAVPLLRRARISSEPLLAEPGLRSLRRSLASLQLLLSALSLTRGVITVLFPPADFVHLDLFQAAFTWLNLLLYTGSGGGMIWLALCEHRRELHEMANTDGLTGLLNRRAFESILQRELYRSTQRGSTVALLLMDIDRFKEVNDSLGHHAGDEVIRRVGFALRDSTRPGDALARYGGEEFVIMMRDCSLEQAEPAAERLRARIAALGNLPGGVQITISIGLAGSRASESAPDLIDRCDHALYGSKRAGRNLVTVNRPRPVNRAPQMA